MASPFRTFRKNQKLWMAAITIMAIIAFVFMGNPMQNVGRGGGSQPPVIRTKFGNLTQPQVTNLRGQRVMLERFLKMLAAQFGENRQAAANVKALQNLLGGDTEQTAIDRWVYARTAESMGIVVDDRTVNDFLSLISAGLPNPQGVISGLLRDDGQGMNQAMLIDIMRQQLLALRLLQIGHQYDDWAGASATPGERWDYFKRFNQQASVEVAVLTPENSIKDVKDPSADDLKQFFEQHKEVEPSPDSPNPGFRVPRMLNLEYLEADLDKYEGLISEDEITHEYKKDPKKYTRDEEAFKEEYEKEKAARAKEEKEEAAEKKSEKKPEAGKNEPKPETKKNETQPEAKKSDAKPEAKSEGKAPATPVTKPESSPAKPATKPDVNPPAKPDAGKTPEPAKPATTATKPAATATKPAGNSSFRPASPFRLVAYATDKPADSSSAPAVAALKKDTAAPPALKADEKKVVDAAKPAETAKPPAATKPAEAKKTDGAAKPAEAKKTNPEKPAATKPAVEAGKKDSTAAKEAPKKETKPIKTAEQRLRDMIRKELARKKFNENMEKIKSLLEDYRSELLSYQEAVKASPDAPKPTATDFAAIAKQYHMVAGRTGLVSKRQLAATDLGKSVQANAETMQTIRIIDAIFGSTALYKVEIAFSSPYTTTRNVDYIFWKTDDQPGGVPKWEDAGMEAKVRHEWKLVQARDLALKAAEALKNEAAAGGKAVKSLKELVGKKKGFEVVDPPKFTWMTLSLLTEMRPKISEVGDLKHIGADFMEKVFSLSPEQVAVATNVPKSEIYVVRMVSQTPFKDLWDKFTAEDTAREYDYVLRFDIGREVSQAWHAEVMKNAGYKKEEKKQTDHQSAPSPEGPEGPPPPEEF
jgi:hypothetical protein